jgi:N-acetyl-gamma-glutamyl-phosphate reductase
MTVDVSSVDLAASASDFYAEAPFVSVSTEPVPTKVLTGTNRVALTYRADARTGNVVAVATIDNLVKGTAGQAIQALNIALGYPEETGLAATGVWP